MKNLLIAILFIGSCMGYLMGAEEKRLALYPVAVGEADGAVFTVHSWHNGSRGADKNIYKITKVDLNGDGIQEVIVGICRQKKNSTCNMYIMRKDASQAKSWDNISGIIEAKEVAILPTATMGWYDLLFNGALYVYSKYGVLGSYHKGKKSGKAVGSKDDLNSRTIEHFGLSWNLKGDWTSMGQQYKFKSYQEGYSNYKGRFLGADKDVYVGVAVSSKNPLEKFIRYHGDGTPFDLRSIGVGEINGHGVKIYYVNYNISKGSQGAVYLVFDEEQYFTDPRNKKSTPFPMHLYINLSGELFSNLNENEIQYVLDTHVFPFLKSFKVTKHNTFTTDTTDEATSLRIVYNPKTSLNEESIGKQKLKLQRSSVVEYKKQCGSGELNACVELATEYIEGKNLAKNYKIAKEYLELACEYKNARGCSRLGVLYIEGFGVNKDSEKAKLFFEKGCDLGNNEGCKSLKYLSEMKLDEQKIKTEHKKQDMQIDSSGSSTAVDRLAETIRTYKNNCIKGDMASCYRVGVAYNENYAGKYNLSLAKQFFDLSCEGGYYRACGSLATVYMNKKFLDIKKAQHFAKIACDKEKENGCMVLGAIYSNDKFAAKNKAVAKQYFSKALKYSLKNCNHGIGSACYYAALLHETDTLGVKNEKKANQFYKRACALNNLDGCMVSAVYFEASGDIK